MDEVDILVSSRDRHTELALLMQALRTQTYKQWNLFICDNASGTPLLNAQFIQTFINRLRLEGHQINIFRNNIDFGICYVRNQLNKAQLEDGTGKYSMRLDDDVLPEPDYIEKLLSVIDAGYDIASGVTPPAAFPMLKRDVSVLKGEINKVKIDAQGNIIEFGDDCGYGYMQNQILSAGHFRSCALYKSEINKLKYPENLSKYGFREESIFSLKARKAGYKIGVHTGAIVWHLQTQSGGGRTAIGLDTIQNDDTIFRKWVQKNYASVT